MQSGAERFLGEAELMLGAPDRVLLMTEQFLDDAERFPSATDKVPLVTH